MANYYHLINVLRKQITIYLKRMVDLKEKLDTLQVKSGAVEKVDEPNTMLEDKIKKLAGEKVDLQLELYQIKQNNANLEKEIKNLQRKLSAE